MKKHLMFFTVVGLVVGFTNVSDAKSKKKSAQNEAKKICLEESPHLAGKELRKCIREKTK